LTFINRKRNKLCFFVFVGIEKETIRKNRRLRAAMQQRMKTCNSRKRARGITTASTGKSIRNLNRVSQELFDSSQVDVNSSQDDHPITSQEDRNFPQDDHPITSQEDRNFPQDDHPITLQEGRNFSQGDSYTSQDFNASRDDFEHIHELHDIRNNAKDNGKISQEALNANEKLCSWQTNSNSISKKVEQYSQAFHVLPHEDFLPSQPNPLRLSFHSLQEDSLQKVQKPLHSNQQDFSGSKETFTTLQENKNASRKPRRNLDVAPISLLLEAKTALQETIKDLPEAQTSFHQETFAFLHRNAPIASQKDVIPTKETPENLSESAASSSLETSQNFSRIEVLTSPQQGALIFTKKDKKRSFNFSTRSNSNFLTRNREFFTGNTSNRFTNYCNLSTGNTSYFISRSSHYIVRKTSGLIIFLM